MPIESSSSGDGSELKGPQTDRVRWWSYRSWQGKRGLDKSDDNYLLNLFTVLLLSSALLIMLVVGIAIYAIFSSVMLKNAQESAIGVVKSIMSAEVDSLLHDAPDGRLVLSLQPTDRIRLDQQMHRYLKFFNLHKIVLFTPEKTILYSTEANDIGRTDLASDSLDRALFNRRTFSRLAQIGNPAGSSGVTVRPATIVQAYSPLYDVSGRLLGIFEVHIDITATRQEVFKSMLLTMSALGAILSLCLFSLYRPMKRGTLSLIAAHGELKVLATRDHLTGAFNRRYFDERVKQEFYRMRRQGQGRRAKESIGFILADIDHFKRVNDTHGHIAGDDVLREVAHRLLEGMRHYDVLCRYGGEEFLIMLPYTNDRDALMVAGRLRQSVVGAPILIEGGKALSVTVSFGVGTTDDTVESGDQLLERVDRALYRAKECGRDRVVLAEGQMSGAAAQA